MFSKIVQGAKAGFKKTTRHIGSLVLTLVHVLKPTITFVTVFFIPEKSCKVWKGVKSLVKYGVVGGDVFFFWRKVSVPDHDGGRRK
jgi:hypothetical protein